MKQDSSFRGRLSENLAGWMMFDDYPFLGVGLSNYKDRYQEYSRQLGLDRRRTNRSAHNMYLQFASELGFMGLVWLAIINSFAYYVLFQAQQNFKQAGMPEYEGLVIALGAGLAAFLVGAIFTHLSYPRYFWLFYGVLLATTNVSKNVLINSQIGSEQTKQPTVGEVGG